MPGSPDQKEDLTMNAGPIYSMQLEQQGEFKERRRYENSL